MAHCAINPKFGGFFMRKKNLVLKGAIVSEFNQLYKFAQAIDTHPASVTHVISGYKKLSREQQAKWAEVLKKPMHELFPEACH